MIMASSFAGRAFAVTGGASGMGLATVKTLLARGACVSFCDLNQASVDKALGDFDASQRPRVFGEPLNVANRGFLKNFFKKTKSKFGRLDGIANVAGTGGRLIGTRFIWEVPTEEYDLVMDANARGVFNALAEGLAPGLMESPGCIVNVASMFAERGFRKAAPYSSSKHAVIGLTKTAAIEAAHRGIRVNAVLPGCVDTPLLRATFEQFGAEEEPNKDAPVGRYGTSDEVANIIVYLLGEESTFVTGACWNVDGGANA
ncbi:hypothetical protein SEUCBS139899_003083 [Sporothrix eucalyptigena]